MFLMFLMLACARHATGMCWVMHALWSCVQHTGAFEFTRNSVGNRIFEFYIDHFFVVCMTNLLLEGQFNLVDEYTDSNHDELLRECILQYLNWTLVTERQANREAAMRTRPVDAPSKKALEKAHKSKLQLKAYGDKASEGAKRHTTSAMNGAMARYVARSTKRSMDRQSAATAKADISDDNCHGCGVHCEEAELYCCDHLGCVIANCKPCTGWTDAQLEGHYYCEEHKSD